MDRLWYHERTEKKTQSDRKQNNVSRRFTNEIHQGRTADIGERINKSELSRYDASDPYGISVTCARDYMRKYRGANNLPTKLLCEAMEIRRSRFYNWKKHISPPSTQVRNLVAHVLLVKEYHMKYPSHGYLL